MLMPKRVKYRKQMRGRVAATPRAAPQVNFGEYGLKALERGWITNRQIEAARVAMTRKIKRGGKVWINVFPDKPYTKKPAETRMGSGKGNPEGWVAVVKPGRVMFELAGVPEDLAKDAMRLAGHKLPIKTKFVTARERRSEGRRSHALRPDLVEALKDARQEAFNLRFRHATGELENTAGLGDSRRDLARLLTIARQRGIDLDKELKASDGRRREARADRRDRRGARGGPGRGGPRPPRRPAEEAPAEDEAAAEEAPADESSRPRRLPPRRSRRAPSSRGGATAVLRGGRAARPARQQRKRRALARTPARPSRSAAAEERAAERAPSARASAAEPPPLPRPRSAPSAASPARARPPAEREPGADEGPPGHGRLRARPTRRSPSRRARPPPPALREGRAPLAARCTPTTSATRPARATSSA